MLLSVYNGALLVDSCMLALLCHNNHCRDRDRGCTNIYRKQCEIQRMNKRVKEIREATGNR